MKNFAIDFIHFFINYIVAHIPFWKIRKFFYCLAGMKIGKNSRILMRCYFLSPWKIMIGEGVYINENCVLDGRGTLSIGNNVSISMYTKIFSGTHDTSSEEFAFIERAVNIESNVWTGAGSIILPGAYLPHGMVLAAGSVAIPMKSESYKPLYIYSGVPAKEIAKRNSAGTNIQGEWRPWFR